ncbi:AIPR family protein [Staphylococcus lentus]|uniref:AIPR family protein n=1 Tax=Mammaliicoccus lentus TaxID=42858 RepID=UPI00188318B1|nr:AIPR family protein [Mammaliicoccus lentus]MBF0841003.1 AIPR family protein [Mammaliicoccus lentus]
MRENKYKFSFNNSVKLISPYSKDNREVFHLWVDVMDIPSGFPTNVNPRDVKSNTKVYKKIVEGLKSSEESFFVNNRGILLSAKNVNIDEINNKIFLDLGNNDEIEKYGVLDGGHTYNAILNHRSTLDPEVKQYVHLEIMTSVQEIDELSAARNTSVQVSDKAIAELADKFGFVKDAIKNEPYSKEIAYRENEDKRLDAIDFVRLMYAFNAYKYKDNNQQPIQAYSGKAQVLKDYIKNYDDNIKNSDNRNDYKQLAKLLPTITKLYDAIETDMRSAYLALKPNGQFGKVKGIDYKEKGSQSKFYKNIVNYQITQGFIFPILSSFRALLEIKDDDSLSWIVDPIEVWKKTKVKLVNNTIEMSKQLGNNPQSTGKSSALWLQNYDAINSAKLQIQLDSLKNK